MDAMDVLNANLRTTIATKHLHMWRSMPYKIPDELKSVVLPHIEYGAPLSASTIDAINRWFDRQSKIEKEELARENLRFRNANAFLVLVAIACFVIWMYGWGPHLK